MALHGLKYFASGAGLFVASIGIDALHSEMGAVGSFLHHHNENIRLLSMLAVFGGVLAEIFHHIFDTFFSKEVRPAIDNGFKGISDAVVVGVSRITPEVVERFIDSMPDGDVKARDICSLGLKKYYKLPSFDDVSYFDYISQNFFDVGRLPTQFWRRNLNTTVNIKKKSLLIDGQLVPVLKWEETKSYDVVSNGSKRDFPVFYQNRVMVEPAGLCEILNDITFSLSLGGKEIVNFNKTRNHINIDELKSGKTVSVSDLVISYDRTWLNIIFRKEIPLESATSIFYASETTYMSFSERSYHHVIHQPTYGFDFRLKMDGDLDGWNIAEPTVCVEHYHDGARKQVTLGSPRKGEVSVRIPGWVLPGIGIVVEWGPESSLDRK